MILFSSVKYSRHIAYPLFVLFYLQTIILPLHAAIHAPVIAEHPYRKAGNYLRVNNAGAKPHRQPIQTTGVGFNKPGFHGVSTNTFPSHESNPLKTDIGGPNSPEASAFKAVGSDNLVNLFTGDFSYSIPLLDVGGYPVNLFYSGGITMEQEASWVGLGWNINPGTVNRNMRGVPDDFNGDDKLIQTQNVKPNRTWGGEVGVDAEVLGIKAPPRLNFSLGFSYNNYLGPALDLGAGVSLSIPMGESVKAEKEAPKTDSASGGAGISADLKLNAKLSSRSGLTLAPSLNASLPLKSKKDNIGVGISTSYNSRQGIRELNLSMSTTHTYKSDKDLKEKRDGNTTYGSLLSSSITFARPSYMPTLRMPMQYSNYSGQIELGAGMFGIRGAAHAQGYYSESKVPVESRVMYKPLVGYLYSEKAMGDKNAVMDLNRVNDAEVTPNTPVISAPQYTYDIFSIQGEGTGGSIRAFRGDLGYMRDNETVSKDNNISLGFDMAPSGHFGGNWNIISTPTRVGGWEDANNSLAYSIPFKTKKDNSVFENVYFRNPGEATVSDSQMIARMGGDNLVRFKLSGSTVNPIVESKLEQFNKVTLSGKGQLSIADTSQRKRDKRTQVTTFLTANDASLVGLDKSIKNYSGSFNSDTTIAYASINRVGDFRKAHHISEIDVLEQSGMRYVYGLPVYNIRQREYTFSVDNIGDPATGIVDYYGDEATIDSRHMGNKDKLDGYMMSQETPAYASSFLLTGLLSPDYVDVTGDGITEDDQGNAVKFNYTRSDSLYRWRTPRDNSTAMTAHFNEGLKSEKKDNKANITYGEREIWYLNSIESKNMIAIFKTEWRDDAKGVKSDMDGRINTAENANKRLKQIDLYTKAEIRAKGIAAAVPVKTVYFTYGYTLCKGTPDNISGQGKLTLKSVYFSYNGQAKLNKERYVFNYGDTTVTKDNPTYAYNASDKWGTYKNPSATDSSVNPAGLTNAEFPFTSKYKSANDDYAAAWSLKKILLPSGGQMEIQYEGDDYAYVQDRRACDMYNLYGLGNTTSAIVDSSLYRKGVVSVGSTTTDNFYVYIKVPVPLTATTTAAQKQEIKERYLQSLNQLAFKIQVEMPKGPEPLTVYAGYDDYGVCPNAANKDIIYVKLTAVDGASPLAKSAIGFITESLPGQAFEGYDVEVDGVRAFLAMAGGMLNGLKNAFKNVDEQMRSADPPKARTIVLSKSFIRLTNPYKTKYGGGIRVKKIIVKDNWQKMLNPSGGTTYGYTSTYGQEYDYTTHETINGKDTVISSGVASYEPGLGSEENPFREILSFSNKMPLASAQYGAVEMPILESFFPAPGVGYSKVTVRSIHRKGTHGDSALRSAIGKQVTEYFTARDYPAYASYTPMSDLTYHYASLYPILYKELKDRKTVSQGFLVETNDMHGKMKSQIAYSASDENTPLSYSYHYYKNTGKNGLNDKVDFVYNDRGGAIMPGNMGVDMELMTDVREFKVQANGFNGQIQTDFFTFVPFPVFVIPMLPIKSYTENRYRAVTCTKLINYHAIEDSVVVMDKGSVITTKTIVYDAETGLPVVTKTGNEFNDAIYNTSYPAYWAYSSMGLAYKNIDRQFKGVNFSDGLITGTSIDQAAVFESGDEVYITDPGSGSGCIPASSDTIYKIWAYDTGAHHFIFMDKDGNRYNRSGVSCRIIRSGKRNNLGLTAGNITSMKTPVQMGKLSDIDINPVAAGATEYKQRWQADNDLFLRKTYYYDCTALMELDSIDCGGILQKNINPYVKGLLGNTKPYRTYVYYDYRKEKSTDTATAIRRNGYLANFSNFWYFDTLTSILMPDHGNSKWVWNSELTKVNSKGQELETRDPLNRYTSAQYGFTKNLPVAMIQNARYGESFDEAFEDYFYKEALNPNGKNSCTQQYIDFNGIANAQVINANDSGFNAHTGQNVLRVAANSYASKSMSIRNSITDSFNLPFSTGIILGATGAYGTSSKTSSVPSTEPDAGTVSFNYGSSLGLDYKIETVTHHHSPYLDVNPTTQIGNFNAFYKTVQYFKVTSSGTYTFSLNATQDIWPDHLVPIGSTPPPNFSRTAVSIEIYKANGEYLYNHSLYSDSGYSSPAWYTTSATSVAYYLPCGDYMIETYTSGDVTADMSTLSIPSTSGFYYFRSQAGYSVSPSVYAYDPSCTYTKPIPADSAMLNETFGLVQNKKMQFSAWIKEVHAASPDTATDFALSNVQILANGTALSNPDCNIKRSGAIIDGWQKIEGVFTIPPGTTTTAIKFINNNTAAPMYVDDIRIHPFNANMKSYVYDPRTLRLLAELDENNYASMYEYDEEGQLIRVKKETSQGVKTINETRSAKQRLITDLQ
ncbi:MAG: hypothetical protein JST86_16380 [Bacteroidetes bacterium]|nr:hypothetical protein [Bacteroidota bacterium]